MNKNPLRKMKLCASSVMSDVFRKVNLSAEEARLRNKYEILGEKVLKSVENGTLNSLKEEPSIVELVGAIHENQVRIQKYKVSRKQSKCRASEKI